MAKDYSFNSYSAGNKVYGGGRNFPTMGRVDPMGYKERDAKVRLKRNALLRRLKAHNAGNFMNQDWLGGPRV